MNEEHGWNVVLNQFIALKRRFVNVYGEDVLWTYGNYKNCIEYWASQFSDFQEMFRPLLITEYNDFMLIKYNLLESDQGFWQKYNGMYRECRGVVLDKKKECLVLTPFRKFFNLNETEETNEKAIREKIAKAKSVEISDKLDGSMQSARYYNNEIILAGSGSLDPEKSFQLKIGYTMLDETYRTMLRDYPDYTFIFEFICKEDQHVVVYSEDQAGLYLIGIRDTQTGVEFPYKDVLAIADKYAIKTTSVFDKTFDEVMNSLDSKKSNEAEGFVINVDGYKFKLKYNDYVVIHRMLAKVTSTNTIIRCINEGTWDDVLSKLPSAYRFDAVNVASDVFKYIDMMTGIVDREYKECMAALHNCGMDQDRKSFAVYIIKHYKKHASYLIDKYDGTQNNFICNRAGKYLKYYQIKEGLENGEA